MSALIGKDGFIKIGTDGIAYIDNWSLSFASDTAEVSALGSRAKNFVNTTISSTGSASGTLDTSDTAQQAIMNMFVSGGTLTGVEIHLGLKEGTTTPEEYTGTVIITGVEIGVSHGDKVSFSFNFQTDGELTYTQAT